jgi:hypothetical protein
MRSLSPMFIMTPAAVLQWALFVVPLLVGVCVAARTRMATVLLLFSLLIFSLLCNPLHSALLTPVQHEHSLTADLPVMLECESSSPPSGYTESACTDPSLRLNMWHQSTANGLAVLRCASALCVGVAERGSPTDALVRFGGTAVVGFLVGFILVHKVGVLFAVVYSCCSQVLELNPPSLHDSQSLSLSMSLLYWLLFSYSCVSPLPPPPTRSCKC